MDDKTFLIKANYMEKSYSVSYLLILSHLQKMLGEDGDYLLAQLISWGRAAIRGYRWQGTEWIAMSVRKHKTFWCLSDITMGASLPWRTGNIGWYLKDFVFCFSKKRIISRWKICGGAKSCIFVRYFIAALIWECHIVKKKKNGKNVMEYIPKIVIMCRISFIFIFSPFLPAVWILI